ncbi:MAG: monoacylglycerol lipase [Parasphingorhabdus sp.]
MIHDEGTIALAEPSKGAGSKLYRQSWLPDGAPKAVIVLVHGYDEHSGRYAYFADHCTARGYAVHAIDHWGHGKSDGTNGFVPDFSVYHDGVDALIAQLPEAHAKLPKILIGHSLGGLIAATYLLKHQSNFAASVLSGPAIKAADEPSAFLRFISRLLSKILPKMGVIALDASGVSRDPKVIADYEADPLVSGTKISARLGHEMMKQMDLVQSAASKITLPLLMLHGQSDSLTAVEGSQFLNDNVGSSEKQLIIYPDLYHEIFNEPEKDKVLTDMTDWIDARLA